MISSRWRRPARTRPHHQRRLVRARRGFSLVAMMVAMVLLVVGLMALAGANAQTVTLQTIAQNRTNAIAITRAYVEQIRTRDPWLVQSEPDVRLSADGVPESGGAYRRSVRVQPLRSNLLQVEVTVQYPRGTQPVKLTTALFRGNGLSGAP
jgi:type II secretory pathway pseudopilin PulG